MKKFELRIGNCVRDPYFENYKEGSEFVTVDCIEIDNNWKDFEPIPLTEEWLLKFGFKREEGTEIKSHGCYFSMQIMDYKYCFAYANFRDDWGFYQEYTDSPFP